MPVHYATITTKKFLDQAGLTYYSRKQNEVLEVIIDGIQDVLEEKVDLDSVGANNGVAELDSNGKILESRLPNKVLLKLGTTGYWNSRPTFIPEAGEIIVYTDRGTITQNNETVEVPGIKIGDGLAYGVDLPFVGEDREHYILSTLMNHTNNNNIHVTAAEKEFWNDKVNVSLSGEVLYFFREAGE